MGCLEVDGSTPRKVPRITSVQRRQKTQESLSKVGHEAHRTKKDDMDAVNPNERRTIIRNPGNTIEPVRLRLEEGEIVARVWDITVAGIGILASQCLELGSSFVLEPAEPNRCLSPELRAEVRHVWKFDKDDYLIGCRFFRLLTMTDVIALG